MRRKRRDLRDRFPNDPSMPVVRDYTMGDGSKRTLVDPDYERRYREFLMESAPHPNWRKDPTYDLKRKRKKP